MPSAALPSAATREGRAAPTPNLVDAMGVALDVDLPKLAARAHACLQPLRGCSASGMVEVVRPRPPLIVLPEVREVPRIVQKRCVVEEHIDGLFEVHLPPKF